MKHNVIELASTDHEAVKSDVKKILPEWNGETSLTWRLNADYSLQEIDEDGNFSRDHLSGYRLDLTDIGDRVVNQAAYDENDNLISPAEYAGELRFDIKHPPGYKAPELTTRKFPKKSDHEFS